MLIWKKANKNKNKFLKNNSTWKSLNFAKKICLLKSKNIPAVDELMSISEQLKAELCSSSGSSSVKNKQQIFKSLQKFQLRQYLV